MSTRKFLLLFVALFVGLGVAWKVTTVSAVPLQLGVNDKLTEITAVLVKDVYYVPLDALAKELNYTLTEQAEGLQVESSKGSIRLSQDNKTAILLNGTSVPLPTFHKNGELMVPLRISVYLGYAVSFKPDQRLLRVQDETAQLGDDAFVSKYKTVMQQKKSSTAAATQPGVSPSTADVTPGAAPDTSSETTPAVAPDAAASATPEAAPDGQEKKSGGVVYLTFDDGPTETTTQLLDILAQYEAKATFFMLGPNMNRHPAAVKRIAGEGHALGLHGMTHQKEKFYASPSAALAEMDRNNAILEKITGVRTTLIRTPYGSKPYFKKSYRDKVLNQDYHLWDWNVDSKDWKYKEDSPKIYNTVMNQISKEQEDHAVPLILMHDQKTTLKVLPSILETLQKEGYQFGILTSEMQPVNFWKDRR